MEYVEEVYQFNSVERCKFIQQMVDLPFTISVLFISFKYNLNSSYLMVFSLEFHYHF